jgi:solute carrier family 25 (mitochondrial carnitine/acylcarnitine transporter), member 20/29
VIAGSPLDVARVRQQHSAAPPPPVLQGLAAMVRAEGWRSIFRGLSVPLLTGVVQNGVTFQAYGVALRHLSASHSIQSGTRERPSSTGSSGGTEATGSLGGSDSARPAAENGIGNSLGNIGNHSSGNVTAATGPTLAPNDIRTSLAPMHCHLTPANPHETRLSSATPSEASHPQATSAEAGPPLASPSDTQAPAAETRCCEASEGATTGPGTALAVSNAEVPPRDERHPLATVALAGAVAGGVQCLVTVPQELIKIRLQIQTSRPQDAGYMPAHQMAAHILRGAGPSGLFKGLGITLLRDVPSYGLYFWVYEVRCLHQNVPVAKKEENTEHVAPPL